jgi:hypothetical protein
VFWCENLILCAQTEISVDFYLAYLRAAFHTCYYCAIVSDHLEELQRKCLKHARKPVSKAMLEALETERASKINDDEKEEKERAAVKERSGDNREWKRHGVFSGLGLHSRGVINCREDERWTEWLDTKVALLINRDVVDPRDYGGKSYDEYVPSHGVLISVTRILT